MQIEQSHKTGLHASMVHWNGVLTADPAELRKLVTPSRRAKQSRWVRQASRHWNLDIDAERGEVRFLNKPNLVVNAGVQRSLDKLFGLSGPPGNLVRMGVDNSASAPTASDTQAGGSTKTLLAFDALPTRTAQTVTAIRTFTNSNVNFAMRRLFLSAHTADITNATTADTAGTLYSMTAVFTIDFTSLSSWTIVFSATVTGVGA